MKKGWITLCAGLILGVGIGGYYYFQPKKALNIIIPKFETIQKVHIELMKDTALIDADVLFENKGIFKIHIDSLIYNIKLDTLTMLSNGQYLNVQLSPSQLDTVRLPIKLPFKRLRAEIEHLQKQDSVGVTFDLRVVYSTWLGKASLPYKKTITIAVPIPPKLEVVKLDYTGRDKKLFRFNAHVKIINKGKLDLRLTDIKYRLIIKDNLEANGKDEQEIHLKPGSEVTVVLPISVKFDNLLKTLVNVVTDNDQVTYHLKIDALARIDKLSEETTIIQVEKRGITELKK